MELAGHRTESVYQRYDIVAERDLADGVRKYAGPIHKQRRRKKNAAVGEMFSLDQIFPLGAPASVCMFNMTVGEVGAAVFSLTPSIATALSTLFGAIVGYVSAILLHKRDTRELQRGAGRALMAEMFTNADHVLSTSVSARWAEASRAALQPTLQSLSLQPPSVTLQLQPPLVTLHPPRRLSDTVWVSEIGVISGFLYWKDLTLLVDAYDASRFSGDIDNPLVHSMCLECVEGILQAIEVLRRQSGLLNAAELSDVDDRLKKTRERVEHLKEFIKLRYGDHSSEKS
jgi:hypothetical protein